MRGTGRVVFAATLLLIVGTLNIIYGIGALDDANVFVNDTRFIFDNLNTLGWVLIILGAIQLGGGFSLMAGNAFGRILAIIGGSLGAIDALLRSAAATRGGRSASSPCVSTSSTASSSSARTRRRHGEPELTVAARRAGQVHARRGLRSAARACHSRPISRSIRGYTIRCRNGVIAAM